MKLGYSKDGGPESTVDGWFFEIKSLFTIALLRFGPGSRDAFHNHAFHCVSWLLKGRLLEEHFGGGRTMHEPSFRPIHTKMDTYHKVTSIGTSWVFTLRGAWRSMWQESVIVNGSFQRERILTHGRVVV